MDADRPAWPLDVRPGQVELVAAVTQDEWWVDIEGRPHLLTLMSPEYRAAVIDYLVERASRVRSELMRAGLDAMLSAVTGRRDDLAAAAPLAALALDEMTGAEVLEATRLMIRLRGLQAAGGQGEPT